MLTVCCIPHAGGRLQGPVWNWESPQGRRSNHEGRKKCEDFNENLKKSSEELSLGRGFCLPIRRVKTSAVPDLNLIKNQLGSWTEDQGPKEHHIWRSLKDGPKDWAGTRFSWCLRSTGQGPELLLFFLNLNISAETETWAASCLPQI